MITEDDMDEHKMQENSLIREDEEDFEELFKESFNKLSRLEPGQKVKSVVVDISGDLIYIDLGGKTEGVVELKEFYDEAGEYHVKPGDEIEVFFVSVQNGLKRFTTITRGLSTIYLSDLKNTDDDPTNDKTPYSSLMNEIHRNKDSDYCGGIINKYDGQYPVWAFVEIIPFGSFISFLKFCGEYFNRLK